MKMRDRLLVLTVFMLFLFSARAAIFDPGVALKANMAQETPTNPYTDLNGGVWMYGMATAATNGTVSTLTKTTTVWASPCAASPDRVIYPPSTSIPA